MPDKLPLKEINNAAATLCIVIALVTSTKLDSSLNTIGTLGLSFETGRVSFDPLLVSSVDPFFGRCGVVVVEEAILGADL